MDRISLRGLRAWGRHGANPGEQDVPQPLDLDIEIDMDLRPAARSDALADTLDYDALSKTVRAIVADRSFALLERLGQEIADAILRDARVVAVRIAIGKPGLLDGATPGVTLQRGR